jgi:hypothetical protein
VAAERYVLIRAKAAQFRRVVDVAAIRGPI